MQIILNGSLLNTALIRQRSETHELVVGSARSMALRVGLPRVNVKVQVDPLQTSLFRTKQELLDHQNRPY